MHEGLRGSESPVRTRLLGDIPGRHHSKRQVEVQQAAGVQEPGMDPGLWVREVHSGVRQGVGRKEPGDKTARDCRTNRKIHCYDQANYEIAAR